MRLILLILIITSTTRLFGQNRTFQYSELGLNDFVVTDIDSTTKEILYNKTLNWIKETYKNPDQVLTMKIENEKVRVDAVAIGLLKTRGHASNLNYVIEVSFKDNKYRFEIVTLLYENIADYKKIPNFKTDSKMIKNFGTTPVDIEKYFNSLNDNLKAYISGQGKKDDW